MKKYTIRVFIAIIIGLYLVGCKSSSSRDDCSVEGQNKSIYDIMHDSYLWYQYTPEIDYSSYSDKNLLLDDLVYKKYDKWSYITTTENYEAYYEEGTYIGLGYSKDYLDDKLYLVYVYKNSPASRGGLKRGTEILAINGKSIKDIEDNDLWSVIYGDEEVGVKVNLKVKIDSQIKDINVTKDKIKINTVLEYKILDIDSQKIAYLLFKNFIEPSREELRKAFEEFKKESIDELILDLRYNGGGRLDVAKYLASLIGGQNTKEKVFQTLSYNDKYTKLNSSYKFSDENISLGLDSIYVITTEGTASASESVINGLKPFIDVYLIGSNTHGKPVGMNGYNFCGTHIAPIMFKVINANEEGDYFDGFTPVCSVDDNITQEFGNIDESMLRETLFYIKNRQCSTVQEKRLKQVKEYKSYKQIYRGFNREIGAY